LVLELALLVPITQNFKDALEPAKQIPPSLVRLRRLVVRSRIGEEGRGVVQEARASSFVRRRHGKNAGGGGVIWRARREANLPNDRVHSLPLSLGDFLIPNLLYVPILDWAGLVSVLGFDAISQLLLARIES
jgi:hypothetical protein